MKRVTACVGCHAIIPTLNGRRLYCATCKRRRQREHQRNWLAKNPERQRMHARKWARKPSSKARKRIYDRERYEREKDSINAHRRATYALFGKAGKRRATA